MRKDRLKLLLTILFAFSLISCNENNTHELKQISSPNNKMEITKINYEGHSYIWVEVWPKRAGLTHDMNCECFKFLWKNKSSKSLIPNLQHESIRQSSPDGM